MNEEKVRTAMETPLLVDKEDEGEETSENDQRGASETEAVEKEKKRELKPVSLVGSIVVVTRKNGEVEEFDASHIQEWKVDRKKKKIELFFADPRAFAKFKVNERELQKWVDMLEKGDGERAGVTDDDVVIDVECTARTIDVGTKVCFISSLSLSVSLSLIVFLLSDRFLPFLPARVST